VEVTPATVAVMASTAEVLSAAPVGVARVSNSGTDTSGKDTSGTDTSSDQFSAIRVGCYSEEDGNREDPGGLFKGAFF